MGFEKYLVFVVAMAFVAVATPLSNKPKPDGNVNDIIHVGSVEGKAFFMETTERRTWADAKAFCNNSGMVMAKVESPAQANLLLNSVAGSVNGYFWLNARNGYTLEHMAWDDTKGHINDIGAVFIYQASIIDVCMQFYPKQNGTVQLEWGAIPCDLKRETLCQVTPNN